MGGKCTVSVIMPAYNAERTIAESVMSVCGQEYADWELIIVDDCSAEPVSFDHPRATVVRNGANRGVAYSRNRGMELAKGEYVAFLDADDVWAAGKLGRQLGFMAERDAQISYTASSFFGDGCGSGYILPAVGELRYSELLKRNLMSCSSVMARRGLLAKYPFPLRKNTHEDYAVWLRVVREIGVAHGLDEPLLAYRLSKGSKSASRAKSALMTYNAYREAGYSAAASAALTARYSAWSVKKRAMIANTWARLQQ